MGFGRNLGYKMGFYIPPSRPFFLIGCNLQSGVLFSFYESEREGGYDFRLNRMDITYMQA